MLIYFCSSNVTDITKIDIALWKTFVQTDFAQMSRFSRSSVAFPSTLLCISICICAFSNANYR